MSKPLLLLPLLSAIFWASCIDPNSPRQTRLPDAERDTRAAICAFVVGCAALIAANEIRKDIAR